jgi:Outer membrane protein beta-barrel domain
MFRRSFIVLIGAFLLLSGHTHSQTFSKFGIKAGFLITGLHTFNKSDMFTGYMANTFIGDSSKFFSSLNFDVGLFTEWFNSEKFCISAELHYRVKEEPDTAYYIVPNRHFDYELWQWIWEKGNLHDKAHYLSFQILPRYRVVVTPDKKDNIYIFAGPTFDFLLSDESSYTEPNYISTGGLVRNIGAVLGAGFEWKKWLIAEIRIDHDFTGPYNFKYKNDEIARRYTTLTFLVGISFGKI